MSDRPALFLLRRAYGLAMVAEGVVTVLTPFRMGLPLKVARRMARRRGKSLVAAARTGGPA